MRKLNVRRSSALFYTVMRWVGGGWLIGLSSLWPTLGLSCHLPPDVTGATPDSFSVSLLLENEVGNPYHIVWTIITEGADGTMTWSKFAFPRDGTFLLDGIVDMREITTIDFAVRDTMTITYTKPEVVPDIEIEVVSYDFGDVLLGDGRLWRFYIHNRGNGDLILQHVLSDRSEFVVVSPTFSQGIAPAGSLATTVRFTPVATGLIEGTITVESNDPDEASVVITLSGTGISPENLKKLFIR